MADRHHTTPIVGAATEAPIDWTLFRALTDQYAAERAHVLAKAPSRLLPRMTDRDALRLIAEHGDVLEVDGRRYLLTPFSEDLDEHLSALDAENEDLEPEPIEANGDERDHSGGEDEATDGAGLFHNLRTDELMVIQKPKSQTPTRGYLRRRAGR